MNKPITEMSQDEIRAEIEELRKIQPPRAEPRKPQRVGERKPSTKKPSWRDQLGLSLLLVLMMGTAHATDFTVRSRLPDLYPGDDVLEPGSYGNPYVIRSPDGRVIGEMRSRFPNLDPDDELFRPGSTLNPYIIRLR